MKDKSKLKVYISGPMTDKETGEVSTENIVAFIYANRLLKKEGYTLTVCPSRVWACRYKWFYRLLEKVFGKKWAYKMVLLYDIWLLMRCKLIYKIPGWRESKGASIESGIAYNLNIWTLPTKICDRIDRKLVKSMEKWKEKHGKDKEFVGPASDCQQ